VEHQNRGGRDGQKRRQPDFGGVANGEADGEANHRGIGQAMKAIKQRLVK
jgi:hypothetical protein